MFRVFIRSNRIAPSRKINGTRLWYIPCRGISGIVLSDRAHIEVSGQDAKKFINGLCTKNIMKLKHGDCVAAAFLAPKGRILFDTIIYAAGTAKPPAEATPAAGSSDRLIIETVESQGKGLLQHLKLYKMRSKVSIRQATDITCIVNKEVNEFAAVSLGGASATRRALQSLVEHVGEDCILCPTTPDPRFRLSAPAGGEGSKVAEGAEEEGYQHRFLDRTLVALPPEQVTQLLSLHDYAGDSSSDMGNDDADTLLLPTIPAHDNTTSPQLLNARALAWYHAHRMLWGIAEGSELSERIPLECNLDLLQCIDFDKGCYMGQELTARTKHQGLVRKRIVPFVTDTALVSAPSSSGTSSASGGGGARPGVHFEFLSPAVRDSLLDDAAGESAAKEDEERALELQHGAQVASTSLDAISSGGCGVKAGDKLTIVSAGGDDKSTGPSKRTPSAGEVVAVHLQGVIGLCMLRLKHLEVQQGHKNSGISSDDSDTRAISNCSSSVQVVTVRRDGTGSGSDEDESGDDAGTARHQSEEQECNETKRSQGPVLGVYRPDWWPDVDPLTGAPLLQQ